MNEEFRISLLVLPVLFAFAIYGEVKARRIPNYLTLGACAFALGVALIEGGMDGLVNSIAGLAIGGGVFLPFCLLGLIGGGDMKLMAATGALVGYPLVLRTVADTCIAGGILAVAVAAWNGTLLTAISGAFRTLFGMQRRKNQSAKPGLAIKQPTVPYGIAIAAGTLYSLFFA